MKLLFFLLPFCSLLFLASCKKDKLEGDKEILIGKWNWIYSEHKEFCNPPYNTNDTLNPTNHAKTYSLEFLKKGKVHFYENQVLVDTRRIVFREFSMYDTSAIEYYIYLDNKKELGLGGIGSPSKMRIFHYPPFVESDCEQFVNYFVKE